MLNCDYPITHPSCTVSFHPLSLAGLSKARDTMIGNEMLRGVSGGERKRCNIAVEMLGNPSLVFLGEPWCTRCSWDGRGTVSPILSPLLPSTPLPSPLCAHLLLSAVISYSLIDAFDAIIFSWHLPSSHLPGPATMHVSLPSPCVPLFTIQESTSYTFVIYHSLRHAFSSLSCPLASICPLPPRRAHLWA